MEEEIWKDIPNIAGYQASNLGNIKSPSGKILKPYTHKAKGGKQYLRIHLGDKHRRQPVHRLVCLTFRGQPDILLIKPEACHKDDDGFNNREDNLYWDTHSNNIKAQWAHKKAKTFGCKNCPCSDSMHDEQGVCHTEGCQCVGFDRVEKQSKVTDENSA